MKKRLILGSFILLLISVTSGFFVWKTKRPAPVSQTTTVQKEKEELVMWEDPAGFTFQYPKGLMFDKHDEDEENYAHIEFTSPGHQGRLLVWAKDTVYPDVQTWVVKDKELVSATNIDTTIGGKPAKKLLLATPVKKQIIGAIDDAILFTIEAEVSGDDGYWINTANSIAASFVFTPLEEVSDPIDEEEVVE